jgi:type II secretory pathway pseudopilin PulG
VVVIITVLAALAIPAILERMRDRRTQQAAQEVAALYRSARMRATARGSAVLVRFDAGVDSGRIDVIESIMGAAAVDPACAQLPGAGCTTADWDSATETQRITQFAPGIRGEFQHVQIGMRKPDGTVRANVDICFSPLGSSFVREAFVGAFTTRMTGVWVADVGRYPDGAPLGLVREVVIPPNGAARLGLARHGP